ncbi:hypothetical protein DPMN_108239 [Dreissena polymorpha]|uniref:Cytochrome c oxidase assembly factor 5 n=1 Tax=Dreissena polymorpha TaxID=45954 RepID=A0A9D4K8D7_DREPO|nr:hypothetical protein DPMN_108239 [Dreissena polymorpha]
MGLFKYEVACEKIRRNLLDCLLQSECYKVENKTPRECMERGQDMPDECKQHRKALYKCKRSQIDTRTRFRGKHDL